MDHRLLHKSPWIRDRPDYVDAITELFFTIHGSYCQSVNCLYLFTIKYAMSHGSFGVKGLEWFRSCLPEGSILIELQSKEVYSGLIDHRDP
jgi:hypothetical protein